MKVEIECLSCIIHRGYLEIAEATSQPDLQFKAAKSLLEYLAKEFNPEGVAAIIGTMRDRIIMRITGNLDIYVEKPALLIGKGGARVKKLEKYLEEKLNNKVKIGVSKKTIDNSDLEDLKNWIEELGFLGPIRSVALSLI